MQNISHINVTPVILCGGSGTRLWPLSRAGFPKQFLVLSGTTSLFQQAVGRVNLIASSDISVGETMVVTGEEHRFIALEQLREMPSVSAKLILEPEGRNTAPALTLAALQALKDGGDPVLVVTPADQTVKNTQAFTNAMQSAIKLANAGSIVILGIKPTGPETGFGYIKQAGDAGGFGEFNVAKFVEKPDLETARVYLDSGDYSWNGGMFVVRASLWIKALNTFRKDILAATENAFNQSTVDQNFIRPDNQLFVEIPSDSVDYAVIEKCPGSEFEIKVMPLDAGWNDLGAWDAVWQVGEKDQNGNLIQGDALVEASENNLIHSSHRLVSAVGVNNLVIIETADAVMVADRSQSQFVKKIVSQLSDQAREEHVLHRKVSRPWGWYDTIDLGDRFKVKRIQVNPGASLSLQKHAKRAEHWVVVKGTAEVTCGDKVIALKENESTFIPLGEQHRLSNPSTEILEIIEVQSGSYLGEDDIVRINDGYGRN
ncbi:{ManC} Mannose-1-phosphate guanylyltransferase [Candidatus Methylopumilus planktonicus]|uniref:mannose-1-phosphate guanylyltransferase/mannose-6-phosphate isomerase n=1 Tax=Candidatus Methylopumilus planktonicus TaxID=1581557 RepID=UPI003BEEB5E1